MPKIEFKTESKKLLDMMINSVYTNKEIFLREIISNASDAIDKRQYMSLDNSDMSLSDGEYQIVIEKDADNRLLSIRDNGCGMSREELENNLGTIAKSGSYDFKQDSDAKDKTEIIGQFGVGFYSAFMVADSITVKSKVPGSKEAWQWSSSGVDGYELEPCELDEAGTIVTLHLRQDKDDESYSEFLDDYRIRSLIRKYSDYIRYPIRMEVEESRPKEGSENEYETVKATATLNSMVPIWRRSSSEVSQEEYNRFYRDKFFDYEPPVKVIHFSVDGTTPFEALLFIPSHAPYDYYTKMYEKGLSLYSNGVMIMEKCPELLPDHFGFVHGIIDSDSLTLNISRETLQHNRQLTNIERAVEKRIKSELLKLLESDRDKYTGFFEALGLQLKYGLYADFGVNKDTLKDLVMFYSSNDKKLTTLKEYVGRMKEDQKAIYYACGSSIDAAAMLPQAEAVIDRGYEVLYLKDDVDEFALKTLSEYDGKTFTNVSDQSLDISSEEEKANLKTENDSNNEMLDYIKTSLGDKVSSVRFSSSLKDHPVCLSSEGGISLEMEKVLNSMPQNDRPVKAETILEINVSHPIAESLKKLYFKDKDKLASYSKILYAQAKLIGGMEIDNPTELSNLVCELMV